MSSSEASSSIPFKSKKSLCSTPKAKTLDPNLLSSKPPEKPLQLPRRTRNQNVALSLKEVRKAAESRRQSARKQFFDRTDQIASARRHIVDSPYETAAGDNVAVKSKSDAGAEPKLPEKYEILSDFFNSLDNSIRLLRLKGSTPTFTNICPKVEYFTDRRFTYRHLAQLKFILPEVIEIKRTLVFNERTSCMKPDLHITMNLEAIENDGKSKSEGGNLYLRRVFQSRLAEFSRSHPEGCEVPEEMLPEPFNVKQGLLSNLTRIPSSSSPFEAASDSHSADPACDGIPKEMHPVSASKKTLSEAPKNQQPVVASHLSPSFRRRFSQKPRSNEVEITSQKSSEPPFKPPADPAALSSLNTVSSVEETTEETSSNQVFGPANVTPSKKLSVLKTEEGSPRKSDSLQSTPAKLASTPLRLMTATPTLHPPKRSYKSPEDNSTSSPNKLVRRPPRTRSLKFDSPVKNKARDEDFDVNGVSVDNDILDILPENLWQSIRDKERKAAEERDPAISQAKRRKQMIACLPKLFNMIHFLFQSINRSVITKEELMHKIISSHMDVVDRREVEEQLSLLLELVPDWISEKLASGGDLLFRINKMSSPESVRARLEGAN
ncbi:CDT1-like protein a, chloroplastic [Morus notabilis]|uniref:CDT1-like protein a, chloroplastic n=1 Tax=Morus notabilis TaxID=981085 RepID=UPI000CED54CC|nr:CDT1-like protein a, chloroplastic [Morus notabilis]